jgi:hypothetical protein
MTLPCKTVTVSTYAVSDFVLLLKLEIKEDPCRHQGPGEPNDDHDGGLPNENVAIVLSCQLLNFSFDTFAGRRTGTRPICIFLARIRGRIVEVDGLLGGHGQERWSFSLSIRFVSTL